MPRTNRLQIWKYMLGLAPPVFLLAALVGALGYAYALYSQEDYWRKADEENMREWLNESRIFRKTLPELAREYVQKPDEMKEDEIREQLAALGEPTKTYQGQLPLFPVIYRLHIEFNTEPPLQPVAWESELPYDPKRVQRLEQPMGDRAVLRLDYQVHAFNTQQQVEAQREEQRRNYLLLMVGLSIAAAILAAVWVYYFLRRERDREMRHLVAQHQVERAEKLLLENELQRQDAERKQGEMERKFLEQRVATQEAEQKALEVKSQLYASIGIMAGSYAHNIKNLLVRPNDLLSRCLEADGLPGDQHHMLQEVQGTLHTVTERLQQILKTVRRDPTRSELAEIDLNEIVIELQRSWEDMAREKWKLTLTAELWPEPLHVQGDLSHLMQAVENLLFNARDATFEMRNHVRDHARRETRGGDEEKRRALIAAAAWKGSVVMRTRTENGAAILEVQDNGIGMTDDVRRRCTETHFSTKRDNAAYEGNTTGMGLGLSFVQAILEHHRAKMEITSAPQQGATFRLYFPVSEGAV